jgi:hypothetical protein
MKTTRLFLTISRSFLLRLRNFSDKICRRNQTTHFVLSKHFRKSCRLWDNVEKYCTAGQATDWQFGECALHAGYLWLRTHSHYVYLLLLRCNNGCTNVPQCYVIRTLPVLFILQRSQHNSSFFSKCNIYMCFLHRYYRSGVLHFSTCKDVRDAFLESS